MIVYDTRQVPLLQNLVGTGYRGQMILTEAGQIDMLNSKAVDILPQFSTFSIYANSNLVPGTHTDKFKSAYLEKYGEDPSGTIAGYGYDTIMILADAVKLGSENGTINTSLLQKGLEKSRYFGVSGPKVFDLHNAIGTALDRWVFKDGNLELVSTSLV